MTRKDSEKDSERPHYYSQFWLDVAAGRRIIGTPKTEEGEPAEPEGLEPEPAPQRRTGKAFEQDSALALENEYSDEPVHVGATPEADEVTAEPDEEEFDTTYPEETSVADTDIPDMDLDIEEEEEPEEEEEFLLEEEESDEEEDEDLNWGARGGRKKAKPTRPTKPVSKKPGKRDTRRGY